jgi:hypothetical protein
MDEGRVAGAMGSRLLSLTVVAVALLACDGALLTTEPASTQPPPVISVPGSTPPPGGIVPFSKAELGDGNQVLTIDFVGGRFSASGDPCSRDYAGSAEAVGDRLAVAVVDVKPPRPNVICSAEGYERSVAVRLPAPFVGSRIDDRAGYVHFLRAPAGLAELRGLPAGWLLRAETDVADSPTGRWLRTYSPAAVPPTGTSKGRIDLYQAFGGPASISGGEEQRTVTVNGQRATQYRSTPDGELVLVWMLGTDGLALVANEADFSVETLVELAESTTES